MRILANLLDRVPVDNKLIVAGVTFLLTKLLVSQGIDLGGDFLPGYLSWAQAVALAASGVAGWFASNDGTVLRTEHDDGNAKPPDGVKLEQPRAARSK